MILDRVEIKNFRSIKKIDFNFNPAFKILVGKNESGKSNIIKALSFLSPNSLPTKDDRREFLPEEELEKDSHVRFIFKLEEKDINEVYETLQKEILIKDNTKIIKYFNKTYTLKEFCNEKCEGLYVIDLNNLTKKASYWSLSSYYEFLPNIKRSKSYTKYLEGQELGYDNSLLIDINTNEDFGVDNVVSIKVDYIYSIMGKKITEIITRNLPETIYWQYDEKNLLPNQVNINLFKQDPDSYLPLKILFNLAGYANINKDITNAQNGSGNQFDNLLKRVSKRATDHFRNIWKEYPDISFSFTGNGENIICAIEEENKFPLNQRSDGFKRFITFLILISANEKNDNLKDALILFDEPDVSLHPSGIRYLRDELIRVSEYNFIVASTHSIFLIDNERMERHLIVSKENEITTIKEAHGEDIFEEEVLYKAIGFSIYELIKKQNIIFEGWRDKEIFKVVINNPQLQTNVCKKLKNYGCFQSNGVKGIKTFTPIFESLEKNCIIITDADEPAQQRKNEYEKIKGFGEWKTYKEIDEDCNAITGEDFLKKDYINKKIFRLKKDYPLLKNNPDFSNQKVGVIENISSWIKEFFDSKETVKEILNEFKGMLFEDLKSEFVDKSYYNFLKKLLAYLEK